MPIQMGDTVIGGAGGMEEAKAMRGIVSITNAAPAIGTPGQALV